MENNVRSLFDAISLLGSRKEVENFFLDLCTSQELEELEERWLVCQLLASGNYSYREISKKTGASTTTVTRVARFLNKEPHNGYKTVLAKIEKDRGDVN
ncbi:MAG: trp operon repressor [Holosporales bacterium]|jgi:TrpR-related protein YerC/YecD|nr:trp operon repressor [Holosporales bacterium]